MQPAPLDDNAKILVTGAAGFIGFHLCKHLLGENANVMGIDNLNDYYDVNIKKARLQILQKASNQFKFSRVCLSDMDALEQVFQEFKPTHVVNLAAQAGVRYSLSNPSEYVKSNIAGFVNVLENCRHHDINHLVYASSSSVYGANTKQPFDVHDNVDHPLSLYAASKKSNELMAHTYSHLFDIPTTGLRFFTVYGPWGRPDMALFLFCNAIYNHQPINVFNYGNMRRDFTFVDDIIDGVRRVLTVPAKPNESWNGLSPDAATSRAPYRLYNIGNGRPVQLEYAIQVLEQAIGIKAIRNMLEMQPGDVSETSANIDAITQDVGFYPKTSIEIGIPKFVAWYKAWIANPDQAINNA